MLKEFQYRFTDTDKHQQGTMGIVAALDFMQADEFAYLICIQLGKDENDWNNEINYVRINQKEG